MISPRLYQSQIEDLGIEGLVVSPETIDEANTLLDKLNNMEKVLNRIRYNLRMDIRIIRKEYMDKIKIISDSSKVMKVYNKQRPMKDKIKEKRNLIDERDMKIAPYESIEYMVDDYLRQIKAAQSYVISFSKKLDKKTDRS